MSRYPLFENDYGDDYGEEDPCDHDDYSEESDPDSPQTDDG